MRTRSLVLVLALALAIPAAASANQSDRGGPAYQVSGGGQVIASADEPGPGDTIAFVAQLTDSGDVSGQLQVVARGDDGEDRGQDQQILHGRVTCVEPGGDRMARFGGEARDPRTGDTMDFVVDVTDADEQGNDTVLFREYEGDSDNPCDDEENGTQLRDATLARGNVKIHERSGE